MTKISLMKIVCQKTLKNQSCQFLHPLIIADSKVFASTQMPGIVPQFDRRLRQRIFVAQNADACRVENKEPAAGRFQSQPPRGKYPQEMSARKNQDVVVQVPNPFHHTVGSRANCCRRFATGATVTKNVPV